MAWPGPPPVAMYTMSKLASAAMTVTVMHTPISCRRLGRVIDTNSRTAPAPSRRADS